MKESLLKWAHYLGKGTTWGYATRKDCMVVMGFWFLLSFVLGSIRYLVSSYYGSIIGFESQPKLFVLLTSDFSLVLLIPLIANFSLIFMRINDICGKRYFITKGRIFAFIAILISIKILGYYTEDSMLEFFALEHSFSLLFIFLFVIMCICPSASGEREEMPVVEYKLPKKAVLVLSCISLAIYLFSLYAYPLFAKNYKLGLQ